MKKRNINKKIIGNIIIALGTIIIAVAIYIFFCLNSKIDAKEDITLQVKYNTSINDIIGDLNQQGLLTPQFLYAYIAKFYAWTTNSHILAGVHKFDKNLTNGGLIEALFSGKNLLVKRVTFPEGITINKFASILNKQMNIDSTYFVQLCNDKTLIEKLGINANSLEGYLMPATFDFFVDITPETIIKTLVNEQKRVWKRYENSAKNINMNFHTALTLASIIEAETPVIAERKIISGIYHNRLKKNMLLQADPTVQYALGNRKKKLLFSDLKIDSPYNTYIHYGLPPTPINSPSPSSIEAAVKPDSNNFYYFVAIGDGSNKHNYSKTFQEHKQQIVRYKNNMNNRNK
jgi:UPF0755 protein